MKVLVIRKGKKAKKKKSHRKVIEPFVKILFIFMTEENCCSNPDKNVKSTVTSDESGNGL